MKIYILIISIVCISILGNSQETYYYLESGKKEYLQETDSLVLVRFVESTSLSDKLSEIQKINSEILSVNSKMKRKIVRVEIGKSGSVAELNKSKSIVFANKSLISSDGTIQFPNSKLIVKIKGGFDLGNILSKVGIEYVNYSRIGHNKDTYLIELKDGNSMSVANLLYETDYFIFSQPSFTRLIQTQNPLYPDQWGLNNTGQNGGTAGVDIDIVDAWDISTGCNTISVAVLDQGVDLDHPDLENNLLVGYDATDGGSGGINGDCWGDDAHGTACAGIIAAIDNTVGPIGVAHDCRVSPIRISYTEMVGLDLVEVWDDDWIVDGLNHAWEMDDVDVISCSWRGGSPVSSVNNEINDALTSGRNNLGCVVVFSAGNYNSSVVWPANGNPDIIAVGAMSPCGERKRSSSNSWEVNYGVSTDPDGVSCDNETWWGSCYGSQLDVVAPGVFVPTTDIQGADGYITDAGIAGNYDEAFNGTSSAAPHVSALAALILSVNSDLTQDQVRNIIESTCTKVGDYDYATSSGRPNGTWHEEVGYGCINANDALEEAIQSIPVTGSNVICYSNTTFTAGNSPGCTTIDWSTSTNLSVISGDNSLTSTIRAKYSSSQGNGWVQINFIRGTETIPGPRRDVWVGKPQVYALSNHLVDINTGMTKTDFCMNQANECEAVHPAGDASIDEWDWQVTGGTVYPYGPDYQYATIYPSSTSMMVEIRAHNSCGWTDWKRMWTDVITCRSYYLSITPNPTSGDVTISVEAGSQDESTLKSASHELNFDENMEWELEVYNNMQSLKAKQTKIKTKEVKLNTQSWKEGIYTVRAKYKDEVLTGKLVVKK